MPLVTGLTIVSDVLKEIGALAQGETAQAGDAQDVLGKVNRVIDDWNSVRRAVYADQILTRTLTPSLNPHTLGPDAATWDLDQRPVSIEHAAVIVNGVYTPIDLILASQYTDISTPTDTAAVPTSLYVEAAWPNANLYFYPVPTTVYDVRLRLRIVLALLTLGDEFDLPPGYRNALTLTVAEETCDMFGKPMPPSLPSRASKARARVQGNNQPIPTLQTVDSGMPSSIGGWFNYLTGRVE